MLFIYNGAVFCLKSETGFFINLVDLHDSVDVGSDSERNIESLGGSNSFFDSSAHNFFKTGVDDIELGEGLKRIKEEDFTSEAPLSNLASSALSLISWPVLLAMTCKRFCLDFSSH